MKLVSWPGPKSNNNNNKKRIQNLNSNGLFLCTANIVMFLKKVLYLILFYVALGDIQFTNNCFVILRHPLYFLDKIYFVIFIVEFFHLRIFLIEALPMKTTTYQSFFCFFHQTKVSRRQRVKVSKQFFKVGWQYFITDFIHTSN